MKRWLIGNSLLLLATLLAAWGLRSLVVRTRVQPSAVCGVVVEEVQRGSEADRAGVKPGDRITGWQQGALAGTIGAPFDWDEFETERAPRGTATLRTLRHDSDSTWTLRNGITGVKVRPALRPDLTGLWQQCRALEKSGKLPEAVQAWRHLAGRVSPGDPPWLPSWIEYQLARVLLQRGAFAEADAAFRQAIQQAPSGSAEGIWRLMYEHCSVFTAQGDWKRGRDCFLEALSQARKSAPASLAEAICLSQLGNSAAVAGDEDLSLQYHEQALSLRRRLAPRSLDASNSLNNLGLRAEIRGDLLLAEQYHRQALALRQETAPDSLPVAASLNNLGLIASDRGDQERAEQYYLQALALQQKLDPSGRQAAAMLSNVGIVASSRGDLARAEEYTQQALELARRAPPDELNMATALTNLGDFATREGDLGRAEAYLREALAIQERLIPISRDCAMSLSNLGDVIKESGDPRKAIEYYEQALAIHRKVGFINLDCATTVNNAGIAALARGDIRGAERYDRQALAIREKLAPGSSDEAESEHNLGLVLRRKGQSAAGKYFAQAVESLESQMVRLGGSQDVRAGFRARYASLYSDLEDALLSQNQRASAYRVTERGRARSLLQMMAERDLVFASDVPGDLQRTRKRNAAEYDQVQAQIAELNPSKDRPRIDKLLARLRELGTQREQIAEQIRRSSPRFASLHYPQPLDLAATRETLDPGTALLSYTVGGEHTVLFVVQPKDSGPALAVFTLPVNEKELQAKVQTFRRSIDDRRQPGDRELLAESRQLYDLLLGPAEGVVAASERLLIIPDGPLQVLPFAALRRSDSQYLVDWKPLHTVVSATVYAELVKMRQPAGNRPVDLAAFGDPRPPAIGKQGLERGGNTALRIATERGFTFGRLPFSRREVEEIAALYPGRSRTYLGAEATEEHAKALGKDVRYIHFATHGLLDELLPLNSALVLTIPDKVEEGRDNGLLQAWEIFEQVRIDADLVTLSACNTGLGRELKGEGLIGLTRAFQYAGARSILASTWSVDDFRTMQLMERFYAELQGGKSKDAALRAAQLQLAHSQSSSAPYYWAGFSLIGDWR